MQPVADWETLQHALAAFNRASARYTTNLFASREQIDAWSGSSDLHILQTPGACLVLRADRDFFHIYHVASDQGALTKALSDLPPGSYVTDLIGREGALAVCDAYEAADFQHYDMLKRMVMVRKPTVSTSTAEYGSAEDADAVLMFLERLLDRFVEQLPDRAELRRALSSKQLLVVRHQQSIVGLLMFDVHGSAAHLRFWHVDPAAHDGGVGRALMHEFLARCADLRRIILWVKEGALRSQSIYRHYGFEFDGLVDQIMILHKGGR